jgi:hemerythrin
MTIMQWQPRFELHVEPMDREHQQLIRLMNELHDACLSGQRSAQVLTLSALGDFTVKHFRDEEAYMASIHYEGLATHKRHHANLLKKFEDYAVRFKAGEELGNEFFHFLRFWLGSHICGVDTKYAEHGRSQKRVG